MKPKRMRFSLHVSILALFLIVVLFLSTALTWTNYVRTRDGAAAVAEEFFNATRERVNERQAGLFDPLANAVTMYAGDPDIVRGDPATVVNAWLTFIENYPQIYEIYVGYETGAMLEVFNFPSAEEAQASKAPQGSRFAVHTIAFKDGKRQELWRFLDKTRQEIARDTTLGTYDPRTRGWYKQAREARDQLVRTPPYPFATSANTGLTFAKAFDAPGGGGVIAADLTLRRMSAFLLQFKTGHPRRTIFTFDAEGHLTAHGTPEEVVKETVVDGTRSYVQATTADLNNPVADAMIAALQASKSYLIKPLQVDNTVYLATVAELPRKYGAVEYLAFAVPQDELAGTILDAARDSVLLAIAVIVIALPFVMWVSRRISHPLVLLRNETERIRRFDLDGATEASSRIIEVQELADAMDNMKNALREVSKFMPKALVHDLMRESISMRVGGVRRTLSFLFTDVKDFTPMAERMDPESLLQQMTEYFDNLVRIVLSGQGTVDKYVGDAIFAFWNAPRLQDDHEILACTAALACREASNAANERWRQDGKPVWYTRFGVHSGEAVVGNVGSSDRLDYTAIGAAVNIASRLEGLNKHYGTQVLVSAAIHAKTADRFLFRAIDRTLPAGAAHPLDL